MEKELLLFINYDCEKLKMAFAKSFKEIRAFVGYSLLDLERLTGINNPSLSRYENGKVEPSISQAITIADCFDLTLEDFVMYGLGLKPDDTDSDSIIERFKENIAEKVAEHGDRMQESLQKVYTKIDIEDIVDEYGMVKPHAPNITMVEKELLNQYRSLPRELQAQACEYFNYLADIQKLPNKRA